MNSVTSILNQLINNHEQQTMDEHSELVYYKMLFKYNGVYSNKIDYNKVLLKLDQILVLISNNSTNRKTEKHRNYEQMIKTIASNIIMKCSYYKANLDKQKYRSNVREWI